MAATVDQLCTIGSVKSSEERSQHKHKHKKSSLLLWKEYHRDPPQALAYPCSQHKATLCIDGSYNSSQIAEDFRGELCTQSNSDEAPAFVALLRACTKSKDLHRGSRMHDDILKRGLVEKCSDALAIMYAKCGALTKAKELLDTHKSKDVVSWTALIAGYVRCGQNQDALNCFERMKREGISPNAVTFACVLKACSSTKATKKGKQIHNEIARQGLLKSDVVLGIALVDMYAKCGAFTKAECALEELPSRNIACWNALITGYTQHGHVEQALKCFECMQHEGFSPDGVTFACILKACGTIGAFDKGEQIHDEITRQGLLGKDIVLGNALVDMYAKCGALEKAQRVLEEIPSRNVISWSALIAGYAEQGHGEQALKCFEQMKFEGISPDAVTYACILKACGSINAIDNGTQIHEEIARQGLLGKHLVLGTALVDMYAKCGALEKARRVLEELPSRDAVSWSALIAGYVQQGQGEQALNCFKCMQREGLSPDAVTFTCILKACGTLGSLDKGKQIHDEIVKQGLLGNEIVLGNALVDMYVKCGAFEKAQGVLEELPSWDVVSWNALIAGYTQQGQGEQALNCFERMQLEGCRPNGVTFSCVLNACSHLGLIDDSHMYFVSMSSKYGVQPNLEHYMCMVDLFGRAGHLEKAVSVIQEMPSSDYAAVWRALLSACQRWGDVNVGRWAFERAVQADKCDGALYVLMANIYIAAGMQVDAEIIRAMRMENKAWV